ncbi:hypothetical protein FQA39_LY02205 [Lamprigera yunnana]|nr:hypothetical protein FQA39_LY02205 [Lamprigera yunnana]
MENIPNLPLEGTEEEDCESFFLQPASSPYNIIEKIKEANDALINEDDDSADKEAKVKFKENLVDYEPEFSYDDASSIETEDNIDYSLMEPDTSILESRLQSALILNVNESNGEDNDEEEIIEDISNQVIIFPSDDEEEEIESVEFNVECEDTATYEDKSTPKPNTDTPILKKGSKTKSNIFIPDGILCKKHCIENTDYLDFNSNIKKINLTEKLYKCPRLKLRRRNCCENNEIKIQQSLPRYNGLRSEYGLNGIQLERRERRKQILRMKEQERQKIIEERKRRKEEQNEEVFCEWLKDVSTRKSRRIKPMKSAPSLNSATILFSNKEQEVSKRPKTASFIKTSVKKRRPSTSCVFIEIPRSVLRKGISIGDLLVTTSDNRATTKKLHVLTVS